MSNSKARTHLDRLSERHHDDFDDEEFGDEPSGHLPKSSTKNVLRSGSRDWDYDANGGSREWAKDRDPHEIVAANLPLAKSIAKKFSNIPGVDPEDIMTAAKEAMYFAIDEYKPERGKFSTWLYRIVRQQLQALFNTNSKVSDNEVMSLDAPVSSDDEEGHTALDQFDNGAALDNAYGREEQSGLRNAARAEATDIVQRAVNQLEPLVRKIVTLHHSVEGGLSVRDIEAKLREQGTKLSSQSVWKYLNRGMAQVKELLQQGGYVGTDDDGGIVHKSERPEKPEPKEPDYADRLISRKAERAKASSASESRQSFCNPLPATYTSYGFQSAPVAVLEAADELLPDDTENLDARFAREWDDMVDEVADNLLLMAHSDADEVQAEIDFEDDDEGKKAKHSKGKGGKTSKPASTKAPKHAEESRRLTARDLTDRLLE